MGLWILDWLLHDNVWQVTPESVDKMNIEWVAIINTVVGIIGITVGIIGLRCLSIYNRNQNSVKDVHDSTIQQAQKITVNNGLDTYAVLKLTRETTQEELTKIVTWLHTVEKKIDDQLQIYFGPTSPPNEVCKEGDIWLKPLDNDTD